MQRLSPIFSARFAKFCVVGASGVVVNLGFLKLLTALTVHTNVASALAIELSILSNFFVNHIWTFGDRRHLNDSTLLKCVRFHLVSLVGAILQFVVFVAMNISFFIMAADSGSLASYQAGSSGWVNRWLVRPFIIPPEVGNLIFLSALVGVGTATIWNFLVNFHWTWADRSRRAEKV